MSEALKELQQTNLILRHLLKTMQRIEETLTQNLVPLNEQVKELDDKLNEVVSHFREESIKWIEREREHDMIVQTGRSAWMIEQHLETVKELLMMREGLH